MYNTDQRLSGKSTLDLGEVKAVVSIHNPSHYLDNFIYSWSFGDETRVDLSQNNMHRHNYTKDGSFSVTVNVKATDPHGKTYFGNCSQNILIKGNKNSFSLIFLKPTVMFVRWCRPPS